MRSAGRARPPTHEQNRDAGGRTRPPAPGNTNIAPPASRSVGRARPLDHVDGPQAPPDARAHRGTLAPSPVGRARPPDHVDGHGHQTPPGARAHRGTLAPSPVGRARARPPEHGGPRLRWPHTHAHRGRRGVENQKTLLLVGGVWKTTKLLTGHGRFFSISRSSPHRCHRF